MSAARLLLATGLLFLAATSVSAQRRKPLWELEPRRKWPEGYRVELEKLLGEADLVKPPLTPLKMARLGTTPELLARMVLDKQVVWYLTSYPRLGDSRYWRARLYGFYLALQMGVEPAGDVRDWLLKTRHGITHRADPTFYLLARFKMAADPPQNKHRRGYLRQVVMSDTQTNRLSLALLRERIPLDADILAKIDRRAGPGEGKPDQFVRFGRLWGRLDASGRKYLRERGEALSPLLRAMVRDAAKAGDK